MNNKTNWLDGRVKEVARVYHERYGVNNITYDITPYNVVFYVDGYFFALHKAMWRIKK